MKDLATATERLKRSSDSLVVVKDGNILISTQKGGIRPLFDAVSELGYKMEGSCIADKVIGKAAAALCISAGVKGVYTPVMSRAAKGLLANNGIIHSTHLLVPWILNKDRSDLCPLEKLTMETDNWMEIVEIVKEFLSKPSE
jgi:hypothetical protein